MPILDPVGFIASRVLSVRRTTLESTIIIMEITTDLQDKAEEIALRIAKTRYVIIAERMDGRKVLIPDMGMGKPWTCTRKRQADAFAAEFARMPDCRKAEAMFIEEAFTVLRKQLIEDNKTSPKGKR